MNLPEYYDLLKKHDWYHRLSDDNRAFMAGDAQQKILDDIRSQSKLHDNLYRNFYMYFFQGVGKLPKRPTK